MGRASSSEESAPPGAAGWRAWSRGWARACWPLRPARRPLQPRLLPAQGKRGVWVGWVGGQGGGLARIRISGCKRRKYARMHAAHHKKQACAHRHTHVRACRHTHTHAHAHKDMHRHNTHPSHRHSTHPGYSPSPRLQQSTHICPPPPHPPTPPTHPPTGYCFCQPLPRTPPPSMPCSCQPLLPPTYTDYCHCQPLPHAPTFHALLLPATSTASASAFSRRRRSSVVSRTKGCSSS